MGIRRHALLPLKEGVGPLFFENANKKELGHNRLQIHLFLSTLLLLIICL